MRPRPSSLLRSSFAVAVLLGIGTARGDTPRAGATGSLTPTLDCLTLDAGTGIATVYFGYNNPGPSTLIPVGDSNQVVPGIVYQGQPTVFNVGSYPSVFAATFNTNAFTQVAWALNGVIAFATISSPRCGARFASDTQLTLAAPVGGSAADTITVRNPGPHDLVVGPPVGLTAPLSVSPTAGFTVVGQPAQAKQPVTVTCAPAGTSTSAQTLTLTTNDPTQPTVSYAISCSGYVPAGGTGTGGTTPELPSGGLLGLGMVALVVVRRWLRRHAMPA